MATILRPSLDRWVRGQQGQRYRDEFAALSGRWVAQAGSLAVSGGALQAAALGDWGINRVTNPELTIDTGGYSYVGTVALSRVDSTVDPGASSVPAGALDRWVLLTEKTADSQNSKAGYTMTLVPGASYRQTVLAYGPTGIESSPVIRRRTRDGWADNGFYALGARDEWGQISAPAMAVTTNTVPFNLGLGVATTISTGRKYYWDALLCLRVNAPALLAGWRSPNHIATLSHVSPAAGVVPFGYITRYTDALNYWEVRVLPNTAGNDLQIVQVTDGVETTRAEADVDWTSDDTDELEVTCAGSTISTAYRKAGAGVWTAGPSYASATQGQTSPDVGVMLYEAGVGRLSGFDVRRA